MVATTFFKSGKIVGIPNDVEHRRTRIDPAAEPPEHGSLIAEYIPGARHVVISGAGHMPFYERPEEFNGNVLEFLR